MPDMDHYKIMQQCRQISATHPSSTGKAGLERRRSSLKKSSRGKSGSVGWSPMKTKAPRRPPPLVLPDISSEAAEGGASSYPLMLPSHHDQLYTIF